MRAAICALIFVGSLPGFACGVGLRDEPLLGDAVQLLDGLAWQATDNATVIPATVPGDLVTDLQRAGKIGDPLYERNFKSLNWEAEWQYSVSFETASALAPASGGARWLVLDSVKMGAWVWFNGAFLGAVNDQFLRWTFDVSGLLKAPGAGENVLAVTFALSNNSLNDQSRWTACSGAWDWSMYTSSFNSLGSHTFTKGIVRSAYVVAVGAAAVEHLQTRVYYDGAYPTAPLTDASAGPWRVVARVHLLAPAAASGTVQVSGAWSGASASAPATLVAGNNTVELTLTVPAGAVRLWWPNELGEQVRYNVTATWTPAAGPSLSTYRAIGFRSFVLVTGNDTDPSTLAGKDGSDSFTMRFKINGANIWSRGANLIPMDEMEGRLSVDAHVAMLRSAAAAHFNTLRVWGGGSYYNDVVYDTADELGLMMYHDTMYGEVRALSRASAFSRRMPPSRHVPAPLLLFAALVWRQQRRPHAKRHARRRDALPAAPFVSPPEHRHARRVQRVLRQRLVVLLCAADNCGRRPVAAAVARVPVCGL
jgi:beta-mannosidase